MIKNTDKKFIYVDGSKPQVTDVAFWQSMVGGRNDYLGITEFAEHLQNPVIRLANEFEDEKIRSKEQEVLGYKEFVDAVHQRVNGTTGDLAYLNWYFAAQPEKVAYPIKPKNEADKNLIAEVKYGQVGERVEAELRNGKKRVVR